MAYSAAHLETSRKRGFEDTALLREMYQRFLRLDAGTRILDIGCGTGFFTRIMAGLPGARVTGLDMGPGLLHAARGFAVEEGLDIRFVEGNALALPFEPASFDRVTAHIMLEVFEQMAQPLSEMARVCVPGGWVLAMEPVYTAYMAYAPGLDEEENRLFGLTMTRGRPIGPGMRGPDAMKRAGLRSISAVSWFWGGFPENPWRSIPQLERLKGDVLERYPEHYSASERKAVARVLDKLIDLAARPGPRDEIGVNGMPVLITKGQKPDA